MGVKRELPADRQAPDEVWSPAELLSALQSGTLEEKRKFLRRAGFILPDTGTRADRQIAEERASWSEVIAP